MPLGVKTSYGYGGEDYNQKKYKKKVRKNKKKKQETYKTDLGLHKPMSLR